MSAEDTQALSTTYDEFAAWEDEPSQQQYKKMKEIRFCGKLSTRALEEDIPEGNLFLFDPNVPQGEDPILTDLGQEVKVIFIRDTKRLEVYEEFNGKNMYTVTSSEFRDNDDLIFLYDRTVTDGNAEIVALLPYINFTDEAKCIKHLKNTRYGKRLRTRYLAYCLWYPEEGDPEIVQIGFTATDNTGCVRDEFKPRGFNDYAPDSFLGLKSAANKIVSNKLFVHKVRVFSKPAYKVTVKGEEKDSKDRIKGFEIVDQIGDEEKGLVQEALKFVRDYLSAKYQAKSLKAYADTLDKDEIITLDDAYIPLMIKNPDMLMGYTPMIGAHELQQLKEAEDIPVLELPASSRDRDDNSLPFDTDEKSKPQAVSVDKAEAGKAVPRPRPKTKDELMAEKKAEREAIEADEDGTIAAAAQAASDLHEKTKAEQAEKIKEVNEVFGTSE